MPSLPLAALSGVLLFLSFPNLGHPAVAWLAVAPLLVAVARANPWQGLRLGAVTGVVHFSGTLYWIPAVMVDYGGLPAAAAWPVHALLVAVLALFPALFAAGVADLAVRFGARGLLFAPALWVTTELGRMHLFTGFPWALLGYSQVPFPAVAQTASIAGVLGVSALVVLVNATIAYAVVAAPGTRRTPVLATAAMVFAAAAFGAWRIEDGSLLRAGDALRVAALQGNVRQDEKWNPLRGDAILDTYLGQTRRAAAAGAGLVVWPESATPFALDRDPRGEAVRAVARETAAHLLVGTTEVVREGGTRYYNAAYLIEPEEGATSGVYRKQRLVPFGEYVPLRQALFFVSPLVESVAGFSAGTEPRTLPVGGSAVGTAICYEIIYPGLVRDLVLPRQPVAVHGHERRLVRPLGRSVPALSAGDDAGDRAGAFPRPRREHRHQRRHRSLWSGAGAVRALRARGGGRGRTAARRAHGLRAIRGRARLCRRGNRRPRPVGWAAIAAPDSR